MENYFLGIDIGTQGARVVLLGANGEIKQSEEQIFPLTESSRTLQSALVWWDVCMQLLKRITGKLSAVELEMVKAVTVTSTSGTVIPLDLAHQPIYQALMYSDNCAHEEAVKCSEASLSYYHHDFNAFNSSYGLPKMLWFVTHFPHLTNQLAHWVHASDFITGKLSGIWGVTDYTNALKSGYDLASLQWPSYLFNELAIKAEWLPKVVPSGTVIGTLQKELASELGLPETIKVTVGLTDGCASQIASGAVGLGTWNTTIGTTLVIKGVTKKPILDPLGVIYNHRHPDGYWMPGGASNTGADWVSGEFAAELPELNAAAENLIPTPFISYPLRQKGERFPFSSPMASSFEPDGLTKAQKFTANMEGVAYIERLAYETIEQFTNESVTAVYTAGGASNSETWLKIRSNVLNKPIYKMKYVSGAVGAAIVAASKTSFNGLEDAVKALTLIEKIIRPQPHLINAYEANYQKFKTIMQDKGYIKGGADA